MAGHGFMQHANNSLKMNKRKKPNIFDKEDPESGVYTEPLELKKASPEKQQKIKQRIKRMEEREAAKIVLALILLMLIFFGMIIQMV